MPIFEWYIMVEGPIRSRRELEGIPSKDDAYATKDAGDSVTEDG